ncbi:acyltransferase [Methylocystis sp. ATCC 49242]|uniref:acyltransferase family protein n=1 Tax=Methylocystis sp. ATCC 49242 TaxID=622637 RepID=UPI0001F888AF|nr:acyltransferase [Methylocystis sp. ATCC 49242]
MNLESALEKNGGKGPGFHFVRHALSVVILLHHASILTVGGEIAPLVTKGDAVATLDRLFQGGDSAFLRQSIIELLRPFLFSLVGSFFVLSGFLVAGSAFRTRNVRQFLTFRILRIVPALSSEVMLSAFVLGPLVTSYALGTYFGDPLFLRYFGNIFGFVSYELPGVFRTNPVADLVNVNLWTLPPEFYCYAIMTAMMLTGVVYRTKEFLWLFLAVTASIVLSVALGWFGLSTRQDTTRFSSWLIVYLFVVGVAMWVYARHIPLNRWTFLICGGVYYVLMLAKANDALAGLALAYCIIYVGMTPFPLFDRLLKVDLSYGIYLYGYPITQALVFFLLPHMESLGAYPKKAIIMSSALLLTSIFAWASWTWIEKPALSLKRFVGGARRKPAEMENIATPAE